MLKPRIRWMRALIAIAALLLLLALSAGLGMAFMAGVLRLWPGLLQNARVAQLPPAPPAKATRPKSRKSASPAQTA